MQPQQLMEHLTRLDSFEVVGKQYHEMFGRDLEFQKYLLLSLQTWETMPPIEALVSPVFEKKAPKYVVNSLTATVQVDSARTILLILNGISR